jgi:hypothetical protein
MKKLILSVVLLFSLFSHAQQVGIKTGLAHSTFMAESSRLTTPNAYITDYTVAAKPGIILGTFVDFRLQNNFVLRSGVEVVAKGGVEKGLYHSGGITETYLEKRSFASVDFPLLLLWQGSKKAEQGLLVGAGLVPGILLEGGLKKGDLGAAANLGYRFRNGLECNLTYNHGLLNVATDWGDFKTLRNRYLGATVGYRFRQSGHQPAVTDADGQRPAEPQAVKNLFAELGGSGGFVSINYDTRLTKSNKGWGFRFGAGAITDLNSIALTIPFGLNYLAGEKDHFFEMGLGATYFRFDGKNQDTWFSFENEKFLAPYLWMGYRYQPRDKRFLFRAGFNQFFAAGFSGFLQYPFPGFSFGYRLR